MESIYREPHQHYAPFSEDHIILVQLILTEFIQAHQMILKILSICENDCPLTILKNRSDNILYHSFNQLLGPISHSNSSIFSHSSHASLAKLKNYCERYSQYSVEDKHSKRLFFTVHRTWLAAINQSEHLNIIHLIQSKSPSALMKEQGRRARILLGRFNQVINLIPSIMRPYLNNENILFCLLRHKNSLVEIYGDQTFNKKFKWPINPLDMKTLLDSRYQNRGFHSLLPLIKQMFLQEEVSVELP